MMHASIAGSYASLLDGLGAPVEAGLERAGLPVAAILEGTGFVPCRQLFGWIRDEGSRQGIDDLGLRAVKRAGLAGLQEGLVADIAESPTLFAGMRLLCGRAAQASSHARMWLEERDDSVRFCIRGSFAPDAPGQREMIWWALGSMCNVVRLFAGPVWIPREVGVVGRGEVGDFAENWFCVSGFVRQQPHWWIAVPRYMMAYPRHHLVEQPGRNRGRPEDPPADLVGSLRYLLRLYPGREIPAIPVIAELADVSADHFERQLAAAGMTYAELVSETRFERARERLADPTVAIDDVAFEAGYGNAAQLAQAFRRFTGMTPSEYRTLHR